MDKLKLLLCLPLIGLLVGCSSKQPLESPTVSSLDTASAPQDGTPLFMAHYMPWYQTPEVSGYWGWHWKMDHFDPRQVDAAGYPQIASHYMPLTGPYDSKDPALLEYQMLLMKMSGIDGVIVDWYGSTNQNDYGVNNQATGSLFEAVKKAGLLFAVCYEDQTVKVLVDSHKLDVAEVYTQGQADMAYLQANWFQDPAYLKAGESPVLFVFGPQYFINAPDWDMLFANLSNRPALVTLDQHFVPGVAATFPWPPMSSSQDGVLSLNGVESYLDTFYRKAQNYKFKVAGAFPGFHDIYLEAGVSMSYGYLDANDGETFKLTLEKAIQQNPAVIQLITWNDYGEGTIIEPTVQFEYRYLEMVQAARQELDGSKRLYTQADLRLPLQLFQLRKQFPDGKIQARLDEAFQHMVAGEMDQAAEILSSIK